jgi:hypothetical protein
MVEKSDVPLVVTLIPFLMLRDTKLRFKNLSYFIPNISGFRSTVGGRPTFLARRFLLIFVCGILSAPVSVDDSSADLSRAKKFSPVLGSASCVLTIFLISYRRRLSTFLVRRF